MSYGKSPARLDDLGNVNAPAPADGEVLVWDEATSSWIAGNTSGIVDDIIFTATANDQNALEIDCDAAGFADVRALDIVFTSGTVSAEEEESAILINIDESVTTGGEIYGIKVLTTDFGAATVFGLNVGAQVHPIEQHSGTFGNMDSVLVIAVDQLSALSSGGAGNVTTFVADDDTITIGDAATFGEIEFLVDTPSSGAGIQPVFEYSTGVGAWQVFGPTDSTNGFRNTGAVIWDVADIGSWAVGTGSEYLIRITRTKNSLSTVPILDTIQISAVIEYCWNKDGDVDISTLSTSGDITCTGTGQIDVPSGTTGQRSGSPSNGMFRYNSTTSQFEGYAASAWGAIGGGGGSTADQIVGGSAASHEVNTTTAFGPIEYVDLTDIETLVRAFDDTAEEYMQSSFLVSDELDTSGTVTFVMHGWSKTVAASKNIALTFGHRAVADSETYEGSYTDEDADDQAVDGTQDDLDIITWTETVSNLGWAAGDNVFYRVSRFAATTNNLSGDYYIKDFYIKIPRA